MYSSHVKHAIMFMSGAINRLTVGKSQMVLLE